VIAVVDYGMGNLGNVCRAIKHCGKSVKICTTPKELKRAKKIILPGVGAFPDAVKELKRKKLWDTIIDEVSKRKPLMGVCLGYQLLFTSSDEGGKKIPGLNLVKGHVRRFSTAKAKQKKVKIPHMGWNELRIKKGSKILKGIKNKSFFYFVHSYYPKDVNQKDILGVTDYCEPVVAAIERDNIIGFQFHPEKSQDAGLRILKNFLSN